MEKTKKIICHEGGSRSSKTFSIFQFFLLKALSGENLRITIARETLQSIRETLLADFKEITDSYNIPVSPEINENRQRQVYNVNGTVFTFWGLDDAGKLHGKKQDWTWINEVMDVHKKHFDQLKMRTTIGMILDYNPSDDEHWVFNLQKRPDVGVIVSTMLDNPFLEQTIRNEILSYKPTPENIANGTADPYNWEVYGLGKRAKVKGAIFTRYKIVPEIPTTANFKGFGLDFGYTNDPTALVELWMQDNEVYLNEILYKDGLTNTSSNPSDDTIVRRFTQLDVSPIMPIYADSAEPKSIEEIKRSGYNIKAVEKGPDSVQFGIDIMKSYTINITQNSANLQKEFRKYQWMEDKNGEPLKRNGRSVPIDKWNHAIDAARYIIMTLLKKRSIPKLLPRGAIR